MTAQPKPAAFLAALTPTERRIFREMRLGAVFVEGYTGTVPRTFGDNAGVWPTRVRTTAADPNKRARDASYDNPVHSVIVQAVYWFRSDAEARRVFDRVLGILRDHKEELHFAWHNIAPAKVCECIVWACTVEDLPYWDDAAIMATVRERLQQEVQRSVRARF